MKKLQQINPEVAFILESYPKDVLDKVLQVRALIYKTASTLKGVGDIEECLKWNEPSYLTTKPKSGTTIRIARIKGTEERFGIFVHCQTTIVNSFKEKHKNKFTYDSTRGLLLSTKDALAEKEVTEFIEMALTYHQK